MAADDRNSVRPEVRKIVAALAKVGACTVAEVRELLRAAIVAGVDADRWHAMITTEPKDGGHVTLTLGGRPPAAV